MHGIGMVLILEMDNSIRPLVRLSEIMSTVYLKMEVICCVFGYIRLVKVGMSILYPSRVVKFTSSFLFTKSKRKLTFPRIFVSE